mmetsp:Transcript_18849/g.35937  ORF Transcript_18849/g.35937 Transcript_18849/m.35937 type:complete len:357 (-) Transcript_18849:383-1453(-)
MASPPVGNGCDLVHTRHNPYAPGGRACQLCIRATDLQGARPLWVEGGYWNVDRPSESKAACVSRRLSGCPDGTVHWPSEYYAIARGKRALRAQVMNKLLTFGTFGSSFLCDLTVHPESGGFLVSYPPGSRRQAESEVVLPGRVRLPPREVDPLANLCIMQNDLVLMDRNEFASLTPGTPVEVQWKGSSSSPHYNWWLAVVERVNLVTDEVTLRFEQYDPEYAEHGKLVRVSTIPRAGGGKLHGGVAGGLRTCTPADLLTWQANMLMGDELDWWYMQEVSEWRRVKHSSRLNHARWSMETGSFGVRTHQQLVETFGKNRTYHTYTVGGVMFQRSKLFLGDLLGKRADSVLYQNWFPV